ncbi:MAG: hypothetical protein KF846_13775 [Cyclobacteriaceae bacterium]|nr:hypothetical protein [Cyclobacteriaceae bacterium]
MPHITKEQVADWADELADIAISLKTQLTGAFPSDHARFLFGMLDRQPVILKDIARLLRANHIRNLSSSFILFRCLLDDFVFLVRYTLYNFDPEIIDRQIASSLHEERWLYEQSRNINNAFFNGEEDGLATDAYYQSKVDEINNDCDYDKYFTDTTKSQFKSAPKTGNFFEQITNPDFNEYQKQVAMANAHSISLWQLYSKYVHYSMFTFRLIGAGIDAKRIEVDQLQEALSYSFKSLVMLSTALNHAGMPNVLRDESDFARRIHSPQ